MTQHEIHKLLFGLEVRAITNVGQLKKMFNITTVIDEFVTPVENDLKEMFKLTEKLIEMED